MRGFSGRDLRFEGEGEVLWQLEPSCEKIVCERVESNVEKDGVT